MRAGKLDKTIVVERFTSTVDDFGTPAETWATLATVRAQLIQSTTDEALKAFGSISETVSVFRIRHMHGVTTADRVTYDGKAFDLKEIKELGRRAGLELRCTLAGA